MDCTVEDLEIIKLVKNGDAGSFSVLVERYHRNLLNFIYHTVHEKGIVEDIGQEVFLSVYQSIGNFDEKRGVPFSVWLFTIARNRCISEIRKMKKRKEISLPEDETITGHEGNPGILLEQKERRKSLEAALAVLDEPFRSTILSSIEGMSIDEISSRGKLPRNTVKTRLFRAREKLKAILNTHGGGGLL